MPVPNIFRAFFSLPSSMTAPDGRPVNAVYGFASTVLKMIDDESLTHAAFAFDRSLTTSFRNEIYPEYKQQRELPPEDLERQLQDCERVIAALGFCHLASERYEADDLIGSLADQLLATTEHELVVVSSDKDLGQLVGERVSFFDLAKGLHLDADAVEKKLGVPPRLVPDFLGLAGDPVTISRVCRASAPSRPPHCCWAWARWRSSTAISMPSRICRFAAPSRCGASYRSTESKPRCQNSWRPSPVARHSAD